MSDDTDGITNQSRLSPGYEQLRSLDNMVIPTQMHDAHPEPAIHAPSVDPHLVDVNKITRRPSPLNVHAAPFIPRVSATQASGMGSSSPNYPPPGWPNSYSPIRDQFVGEREDAEPQWTSFSHGNQLAQPSAPERQMVLNEIWSNHAWTERQNALHYPYHFQYPSPTGWPQRVDSNTSVNSKPPPAKNRSKVTRGRKPSAPTPAHQSNTSGKQKPSKAKKPVIPRSESASKGAAEDTESAVVQTQRKKKAKNKKKREAKAALEAEELRPISTENDQEQATSHESS